MGVDSQGGMNGGVEVGDGDRVPDNLFGEVVGGTEGALMIQTTPGENEREGRSLMAAAAVAVELGGTSELGGDDNEGFVEESFFFKVAHKRGEAVVEVLNEFVLLELSFPVGVPTGAVDEARVVGEFDKADPVLNEAPGEEAALAEFAFVGVAKVGWFGIEIEIFHEARTGEAEGIGLGHLVIGQNGVGGDAILQGFEESLAGRNPFAGEEVRSGESGGSGFKISEVDVAVLSAEKSGAAADIGKADEHVGGDLGIGRATLLRDDRSDRGIGGGAADGAAGVHKVGSERVLIDELITDGTDRGDAVHETSRF